MLESIVSMLNVLGIDYNVNRMVGVVPVVSYILPTKADEKKLTAFYRWLEVNSTTRPQFENHGYYRSATYFFDTCVLQEGMLIEG